ncbi:hypothetical protein F3Y22_tig00111372pilonHSYRG00171 [Hibiscus syriacus]|uniref:glucan endo-1,3-beta-D-glucosidase n=1 Tax=Hibiscus syriacus TaxID=106335 RepID=A0A6A2YMZ9_HIBSY|nr:hypothetical protein F3Y22_tig00111372pilonHSYRG00171 [Hibiscus syriacus]
MIYKIIITFNIVNINGIIGYMGSHIVLIAQELGVNWGVIASHPLDPKIVVQMIKDNGIKKVKIFHAEKEVLNALAGTDLEVMVRIPNESLESLSEKYSVAQAWVKANITTYMGKKRANFKYVAVENEPFLTSYNGTFTNLTLPAMKNVLKALNEAGHGKDIKVSSPLNGDVYTTPTYKPSDGIFRPDIADIMGDICAFLDENDSTFIVNIYPFLNLYQNPGFPENYAFFHNDDSSSMDDNGVKYRNVLDANIDTLVAALKVAKFPDIPIIVGELDGRLMIKRVLIQECLRGTGEFLALMDNLSTQWIFQGKDRTSRLWVGKICPTCKSRGVYNEDVSDQKDLKVKVAWACNNTDCTTLVAGASCSGMGIETNASVAFNIYYQMSNQSKAACDFQGMVKIVKQDPSNGTCKFPIMIKSFQKASTFSLAHSPPSTSSKSHSSSSPSDSPSGSPSSSTSASINFSRWICFDPTDHSFLDKTLGYHNPRATSQPSPLLLESHVPAAARWSNICCRRLLPHRAFQKSQPPHTSQLLGEQKEKRREWSGLPSTELQNRRRNIENLKLDLESEVILYIPTAMGGGRRWLPAPGQGGRPMIGLSPATEARERRERVL